MNQIAVTTGFRFTDIDGYACVLAYKEVVDTPVTAVIPGILNLSITKRVKAWGGEYTKELPKRDFDFVIVDVSEKDQLPSFVKQDKIVEIYDHHFGFEKEWQKKLGGKAKIEHVGACATLIWEEIVARKMKLEVGNEKLEYEMRSERKNISSPTSLSSFPSHTSHFSINPLSANLLLTAIISNTLNFQSSITSERDKVAFEELKKYTDLPDNWVPLYFREIESEVFENPTLAINNDTKIQVIKGSKTAVSQIELWNSADFLKENRDKITATMNELGTEHWFIISPSMSENRSYIYSKSETIKEMLKMVMNIDFFGTDIGVTDKIWSRKEILNKIQ